MTPNDTQKLIQIASSSVLARYSWRDRGPAPLGYLKGMAVVYAQVYRDWQAADIFALEMAKADSGDGATDALTWYAPVFRALGMENRKAGADTLRHLFVLLIGLGMRESSGRWCEGRDLSAPNTTSETAEAGLFQTSWNARQAHPVLLQLFTKYAGRTDDAPIFREGVQCRPLDLENFGAGDGREFQRLSKACPAFAVEFAAIGLRHLRQHWGTINHRAAEIRPEADLMLREVQAVVDQFPALVESLA